MPNSTIRIARGLRRRLSPPEVKLWQALRHRATGLKVRRQHPVGPYVLDFYVAAARLAIEVDGSAHDLGDRPAADAERDQWLLAKGVRTLRVSAADVLSDVDAVVRLIGQRCATTPPPLGCAEWSPSAAELGRNSGSTEVGTTS